MYGLFHLEKSWIQFDSAKIWLDQAEKTGRDIFG
jgi:hypothetical protein